MRQPLQSTDYMYASARVRALENRLVGRERMASLIDAKTVAEVVAKLAEYGVSPAEGDGASLGDVREEMLLALLREAYTEAETAVPDGNVFVWFRFPYDCHNLKTAVKCHIRGMESDGMLFDFGTVPADRVMDAVREGKYEEFPPAMAQATPRAREAYAKTADPCRIDTILDRACYEDMMATVKAGGDKTLLAWLQAKVDLLNVMICVRILRMHRGDVGLAFMQDALLPGGTLDMSFFETAYAEGEEALWRNLYATVYGKLVTEVEKSNGSLAVIETCIDNHWMTLVREGARVPFGAPVVAGYLIGCETSVKNIRIVLAGKDAGLPPEAIRERVRMSYV